MKTVWPKSSEDPAPDDFRVSFSHPVIITLISIAVVIAAVFYVRGWENEKLLKDFVLKADTYRHLFMGRLGDIATELNSTERFLQGARSVNRKEFSSFVGKTISDSREIEALLWAPRISGKQRRSFEATTWLRGLDGRRIYDFDPTGQGRRDKTSPSRKTYFPVLYAEPIKKMGNTIGLDLASVAAAQSLFDQARDEGVIVPITGIKSPRLLTSRGAGGKSRVSLIRPVYRTEKPLTTIKQRRDKLFGFLILQYDIGLALEASLAGLEPINFDIYVIDAGAHGGNKIVYRRPPRTGGKNPAMTPSELWKLSGFVRKSPLNVPGRQWKIVMVPLPQYFKNHRQYQSWGVLLFGLLLSALLSFVAFNSQRQANTIKKTVRAKTKELLTANEALQQEMKKRRAHLRELEFQKYAIDEHAIVSITDATGAITYVNEGFCKISGFSRGELLGQNHRILRSGEHSTEFYKGLWKTITGGRVWHGDIKNKNKYKGYFWVRTTIVPNLNEEGVPFQYVGIRTEITENINLETDLMLSKEEADMANRAKSEFLSSMSHELRTPMNAILGFAQMLEFNPKEPLTEAQKKSVSYIMEGGQHLLGLINEVLDLAKIEAGKMDLSIECVSVKAVLDECLMLIGTMAEKRGIEIVVEENIGVSANMRVDHARFRQSLLNLLTNAVKYNRQGGKITIDCRETTAGMLHISIADTGEGIAKDMLGRLFEPFSRLGAENSEIEGTGIGLIITKRLVESMDGHIGVSSEVGKGSTFWVELPLCEKTLVDEDNLATPTPDGEAKALPGINGTVLYIEDNPANQLLMEMIVDCVEGLAMVSAGDAETGIELARSESPDLILLDINLTGMNGFEAMKVLQGAAETKHIPVIALSANAMPKDIEKGIKAGFKKYLTKPIKVEQVVDAIRTVIEDRGPRTTT